MKIVIPCHDSYFCLGMESGAINGGTATFFHYKRAYERLGHNVTMCEYHVPLEYADIYFVQSEWYSAQQDFYKEQRKKGAKVIVWLGHFIAGAYFDPTKIEADLFITTWIGDVITEFERKTGHKVHYIPHAFGEDSGGVKLSRDIVFAGNTYPLRSEDIFYGVDVTRLSKIHPQDMPAYYRGAKICLNIHGAFQMGEIATHDSKLSNEAGFALNERVFQTSGAGGFQLCQYHPILADISQHIQTFTNNEDLKNKVQYWLTHDEERATIALLAQQDILAHHTYDIRAKQILDLL